jgi:dehydrogenase/reductase SDR family member 1
MSLEGTVAVVAGASRGIGKGIALELGFAGAHLYAAGRTATGVPDRPGSLDETVRAIRDAGGSATTVRCDLTVDEEVAELFGRVRAEHGRLDIFVHSVFDASQFRDSIGVPFWQLPPSIWQEIVDVGTRSAYICGVHAAPLMLERGGLVVHVSGRGASRYRYNVAYGVGKAGLDKLTADMAFELRDHRVAVVSLWPNVTRTETNASSGAFDGQVLETPRYCGRSVVALAADPDRLARSGQHFWVAELAQAYGFTDEEGRTHEIPE